MKVCFIQKEAFPYFGVMSLAGYIKQRGIDAFVLIANRERDLPAAVRNINPDLIAFSVLTTEHAWLESTAAQIRKIAPTTPIIVGGVHAILYPEAVMDIPSIDLVCTGEGEEPLSAVCRVIARTEQDYAGIPGIGFRKSGEVVFHQCRPLLNDLTGHYEDRELYYARYPFLRRDGLKQFMSSRGCPYYCSFCFNSTLQALFLGQGRYLRKKSASHFIEEIKRVKRDSPMKAIFFADDLFTLDTSWLESFLPLYRREIGLPFMCTTRANLMNDHVAVLLKEAGCHTVSFGIETGNERIRREVLRKDITDEQIAGCAQILKNNGIRIQTSNMFCLPDETLGDAFATVGMNIRIKADFSFSTIFLPFPATPLADYCVEKGYLPRDFGFQHVPRSFLSHSIMNMADREKIENIQRISFFMIRYPWLYSLVKPVLTRFNVGRLASFLLVVGTFIRYKTERKISFLNTMTYLWRFRNSR